MRHPVRVWDLPTRIFHWLLAALVVGSGVSGYVGGAWIDWHARLGYAILALLAFRFAWGFVGGYWSRFSKFLRGPGTVLQYLRGKAHPEHTVGHNPLGGLAVVALMAVLLVQVGTGLVSDDEISFTGPLNRFVEAGHGLTATWYHKAVGQWLLLGLVVLHIAAVLFYLVRKNENLIRPMILGDKHLSHPTIASRDDLAARMKALLLLAACGGGVAWLVKLGAG